MCIRFPLAASLCLEMLTWFASAGEIPVRGVQISPIEDVQVSTAEMGLIREVHVRVGQAVEQGHLLVTLNDAEAQLGLRFAQAEFEIARHAADSELSILLSEKNLEVADKELARAEEINARHAGTITASEIDRLRLAFERSQLEFQQARLNRETKQLEAAAKEAELRLAEQRLERRLVFAPCAGVVTRIDHRPGEWLTTGAPCCRIINLARVRAEGFLELTQPSAVAGHAALVRSRLFPSQDFRGTVTFVDPEIDPLNGQFRIWVELDNPGGELRPGMPVELMIEE